MFWILAARSDKFGVSSETARNRAGGRPGDLGLAAMEVA
jgi:hypothetical protein